MLLKDVLKPLLVEQAFTSEVLRTEGSSFVNLLPGDYGPEKVSLQEILKSEENDFVPPTVTTTAFKVAIHILCTWWILLPMAELVAVGGQDQVVPPTYLRLARNEGMDPYSSACITQ